MKRLRCESGEGNRVLLVIAGDWGHYTEVGLHKPRVGDNAVCGTAAAFAPDQLSDPAPYVKCANDLCAALVFVFAGDVLVSSEARDVVDRACHAARGTGGGCVLVLGNHETEVFDSLQNEEIGFFNAERCWPARAGQVMTLSEAEEFSRPYLEAFPCDLQLSSPVIIGCCNVRVRSTIIIARSLVDQRRKEGPAPYHSAFVAREDKFLKRALEVSRSQVRRRARPFYNECDAVVYACHFPPISDSATEATETELLREQPNLVVYGHEHAGAGETHKPLTKCAKSGQYFDGYMTNCATYDDGPLRRIDHVDGSRNLRREDFTTMNDAMFDACMEATRPVPVWILDPDAKEAWYRSYSDPRCEAYRRRVASGVHVRVPTVGWGEQTRAAGFW